jgi:hypothetical protein
MCVSGAALVTVIASHPSRAEDCSPEPRLRQRLAAGGGYAAVYFVGGSDGHYGENGQWGNGQIAYSYSPVRGLDLGIDLVRFSLSGASLTLPAATVRGFLPIGRDIVEIGFQGHLGGLFASTWTIDWRGWSTWVGPDVRVWVHESFGFQLAGQAYFGIAPLATEVADLPNSYLRDAVLLAVGGAVSAVARY